MNILIKNLSKVYPQNKMALNNITLNLSSGIYALFGANGAGKSTFMKILAGVLAPSSGEIFIDDKSISPFDDNYSSKVGYLPQETPIYPEFTAEEFLRYLATVKGLTKSESIIQVSHALESVNLQEHAKKKLKNFSGGMKRRIGIAQLLLNNPDILIIDEPTAGLDPKERIHFRNLISAIARDRIVLLSTHIVSDIGSIAKEIIMMENGCILKQETPLKLLNEIRGYIWTLEVSDQEIAHYEKMYRIGTITQSKSNLHTLRIISLSSPHPNAKIAEPELEDLYLFHLDGRGGTYDSIN